MERVRFQITTVERQKEAMAAFLSTVGWRASARNAPETRVSLAQGVQEDATSPPANRASGG